MRIVSAGQGKSIAARLLRELIDPHKAPLRAEPHDDCDLVIGMEINMLVVLNPWVLQQAWSGCTSAAVGVTVAGVDYGLSQLHGFWAAL